MSAHLQFRPRCLKHKKTQRTSLPQSLSARLAFRNPMFQRPGWEPGARKMYQVREYLRKLNILKSMSPDRMHPWPLRNLADMIAKPLSFLNHDKREKCPKSGVKEMTHLSSRRIRRRSLGATGQSGSNQQQVVKTVSRHIKGKQSSGLIIMSSPGESYASSTQ